MRVQKKQKELFTQCKPLRTFEQGETMTKDEALKLALEAFDSMIGRKPERVEQAITAIKEALAQLEPVAWEQFYPDIGKPQIAFNSEVIGYVAPQRTWVGLTPEDTFEIGERLGLSDIAWVDLMQAIEAKLRDKND